MTVSAYFENFGLRYGIEADNRPALEGINLEVRTGEKLAIIGESGSGKSTLALAVAGLLPPEAFVSGTLAFPGYAGTPRPGRDIGYVFQDPGGSLNPVMTIGKQVSEVVHFTLGKPKKEAERTAIELIERVRLPEPERIAKSYPHQLSGGQRQRVAIAAAIAGNPSLLIADEATSALDTIVQADIVRLIRSLVEQDGMTLLFISHDLALAANLADRIAVFQAGRLIECDRSDVLLRDPQNAYTRQLIAAHRKVEA